MSGGDLHEPASHTWPDAGEPQEQTYCGQFICLSDAATFANLNIVAERYSVDERCQVFRMNRAGKHVGWLARDDSGKWNAAKAHARWHCATPEMDLPEALIVIGVRVDDPFDGLTA